MSLKAFHIFFIALSALLAGGFGVWSVERFLAIGGGSYLVWAAVGFLGAIALVLYGRSFLRKMKGVSYL